MVVLCVLYIAKKGGKKCNSSRNASRSRTTDELQDIDVDANADVNLDENLVANPNYCSSNNLKIPTLSPSTHEFVARMNRNMTVDDKQKSNDGNNNGKSGIHLPKKLILPIDPYAYLNLNANPIANDNTNANTSRNGNVNGMTQSRIEKSNKIDKNDHGTKYLRLLDDDL